MKYHKDPLALFLLFGVAILVVGARIPDSDDTTIQVGHIPPAAADTDIWDSARAAFRER